MGTPLPIPPILFEAEEERSPHWLKRKRRILIAAAVALALHLIFVFGIAPYLELESPPAPPTEVVQITPQELAKMKERLNKTLPPLVKQELREEFKTKERPKDAQFMGAFNQTVPEETMAGAQRDEPMQGGGGSQSKPKQEKLKLSELGLGSKVPITKPEEHRETSPVQGPPGPHRPVGRSDSKIKRGNDNLLNAVENEYYSFFARFEEPIIRNWFFLIRSHEGQIHQEMINKRVKQGQEFFLTLEFVIDRKGNFRSIQLLERSDIETLDWVTREAVRKLGSLPNPPDGIFENGQYFSYRLRFQVLTEGSAMEWRPGLDWY